MVLRLCCCWTRSSHSWPAVWSHAGWSSSTGSDPESESVFFFSSSKQTIKKREKEMERERENCCLDSADVWSYFPLLSILKEEKSSSGKTGERLKRKTDNKTVMLNFWPPDKENLCKHEKKGYSFFFFFFFVWSEKLTKFTTDNGEKKLK